MTDAEDPLKTAPTVARLRQAAREALVHNTARLGGRWALSAGANQFRTLWTRDFCYAARGLLRSGRAEVVRGEDLTTRRPAG